MERMLMSKLDQDNEQPQTAAAETSSPRKIVVDPDTACVLAALSVRERESACLHGQRDIPPHLFNLCLSQVHLASYPRGATVSQLCQYVRTLCLNSDDSCQASADRVEQLVQAALRLAPGIPLIVGSCFKSLGAI